MKQDQIFKKNVLAVKLYFNAIAAMYHYRNGKGADRMELVSICKNLKMSNMMPAHFEAGGILRKESRVVNKRQRVVYFLNMDILTEDVINKVAIEKMNYVRDAQARSRSRREEAIRAGDDDVHFVPDPAADPESENPTATDVISEVDRDTISGKRQHTPEINFPETSEITIREFAQAMIRFLYQYI